MRRLAAIVLVSIVALTAGCGDDEGDATTTRPAPPSPAAALRALAAAAREGDVPRIRRLLTASTRRSVAAELAEGLGSFPPTRKVVLAVQIDETWAVAALAGPRTAEGAREYGVFATPLKLVDSRWKAHIAPGTLEIRPLGPDPGSVQGRAPTQVAAEFSALVAIEDAGLWLDGKAIDAVTRGSAEKYTAYGATPPLRRGYHVVVAFAEAGGTATATAWSFRVR